MNDSIDHLPSNKREELAQVVDVIRSVIDDLEMVILFGSYARDDYREKDDLKEDRWSGHVSDSDILAVTGRRATADDATLFNRIIDQCLALGLGTTVGLIMHDIGYVSIQLAEGQYFFSDIKKEGCQLFNPRGIELPDQRELTPQEYQRIARDHYDDWHKRANMFFDLRTSTDASSDRTP